MRKQQWEGETGSAALAPIRRGTPWLEKDASRGLVSGLGDRDERKGGAGDEPWLDPAPTSTNRRSSKHAQAPATIHDVSRDPLTPPHINYMLRHPTRSTFPRHGVGLTARLPTVHDQEIAMV